ncbi:MAG: Thiol:disulfide interchange protein [Verrucomicrobiales bacterium]|nr:Thiol:disulfide interchange protein [Verrucomicrobiales bacterium]
MPLSTPLRFPPRIRLAAAVGAAACGWVFCVPAKAQEKLPSHFKGSGLQVRLVSDVTALQPGQTFHLGLWIQHNPGYHTYWSNPGIAGVPTNLTPELPDGFTAGGMIYPPPDKVKMAGLSVHGYERDILVALPVTAPKQLSGPVTVKAKASWMCCHITCNPGFTDLSLTFPTAAAPSPDAEWKPRFDALLASQPPAATGWVFTAQRSGPAVNLTVTPPAGVPLPEKPQFFSSDNLICSHPVQEWKTVNGTATVSLSVSDFPPKEENRLRGLLHTGMPGASLLPGTATAYASLDVPIQPDTAKPQPSPAPGTASEKP